MVQVSKYFFGATVYSERGIQLKNLSTVLNHDNNLTLKATAMLFVIWQRVTHLLLSSINTHASS